jgi:transcriptional regulator with XRE-family HTH domain
VTPEGLKGLRSHLGFTQQRLASLLSFSFVSVNKWERGSAKPSGYSEAVLDLLDLAAAFHSADVVLRSLVFADAHPLSIVRVLSDLVSRKRGALVATKKKEGTTEAKAGNLRIVMSPEAPDGRAPIEKRLAWAADRLDEFIGGQALGKSVLVEVARIVRRAADEKAKSR